MAADLPIIRSATENNFIFDLITKRERVTLWGTWLGLYRKADTKFYWIDDTALVGQYSAWGRGEPNNYHEKCGHMFGKEPRAGKWNDNLCSIDAKDLIYAPVVLCQKAIS